MALWPNAWRNNLPWAGQAQANTNVAEIRHTQNPAIQADIAVLQDNNWQLVHRLYDQAIDGGTVGTIDIFEVTGNVMVRVFAIGKVQPTGAATPTVELGVAGSTATLLAQVADARTIDTGDIWVDATPITKIEAVDFGGDHTFVISGGQDIIMTIGGEDLTAGEIDFYCYYKPLSPNGEVAPA